jgi:predicted nucleic acid-binding protein
LRKIRSGVNVLERLTFDSEAILAFYLGEASGELVRDSLEKIQNGEAEGYINVLNLTEIYYILSRVSPKIAEEKQRNLRLYGLKVVPIEDNGLWREAAKIKCDHSLSLADAFAVATAESLKTKLVAGSDKEFNNLNVQLVRIR